ncbi:ABC transmembrane type-1 domain-containing protein [Babesia gibsoni]|uniref:ABC transmembrane type-1 domain-containing protein n=1 Tax=Babesia gibsoni TaxID=33632 RepID=A0AAD8PCC1_BABGI|nr:ABC transmembrane type-1 domain-containing protein [Babesia gibsoni]
MHYLMAKHRKNKKLRSVSDDGMTLLLNTAKNAGTIATKPGKDADLDPSPLNMSIARSTSLGGSSSKNIQVNGVGSLPNGADLLGVTDCDPHVTFRSPLESCRSFGSETEASKNASANLEVNSVTTESEVVEPEKHQEEGEEKEVTDILDETNANENESESLSELIETNDEKVKEEDDKQATLPPAEEQEVPALKNEGSNETSELTKEENSAIQDEKDVEGPFYENKKEGEENPNLDKVETPNDGNQTHENTPIEEQAMEKEKNMALDNVDTALLQTTVSNPENDEEVDIKKEEEPVVELVPSNMTGSQKQDETSTEEDAKEPEKDENDEKDDQGEKGENDEKAPREDKDENDEKDNQDDKESICLDHKDSAIIYETLKNEFIKNKIAVKEMEDVCIHLDSSSDFRTALGDFDVESTNREESVVIDMPYSSYSPIYTADNITISFKDTIKYMKYREALRYYRNDFIGVSFTACLITMLIFVASVYGALGISKIVDEALAFARQMPLMQLEKGLLGYYKDLSIKGFIPVFAVCLANMFLFGYRRIYRKVVKITIAFICIVVLCFALHISILYVMDYDTSTMFALFIVATGAPELASVDDMCFYGSIIAVYMVVIVGVNIWLLFYRLVFPKLLMKMVIRDVERFNTILYENKPVEIPRNAMKYDKYGTITAPGHLIKLQQTGYLEFYWKILSKLTSEEIMIINPVDAVYQYTGQLNKRLEPHGYGAWQSTSPNGETLIGYWENGLPLGSFMSRESKMDTTFNNVLMGWIKCIHGGGLSMGVASVEVGSSLSSFTSFPRVMKYIADIYDEDNPKSGILKHLGIPGYTKVNDAQGTGGHNNKSTIMRLCNISNDMARYSFETRASCLGGPRERPSLLERLQCLIGDLVVKRHAKKYLNNFTKCILRVLDTWVPSYLSKEGHETNISLGSASQVYVDGYVPIEPPTVCVIPSPCSTKCDHITASVEDFATLNVTNPSVLRHTIEETFSVDGWMKRCYYMKPEVAIFIDGYASSQISTLKSVTEMFALWDYPQYIKPVSFSWPKYRWSDKLTANSREKIRNENKTAFQTFLESLLLSGITDIHIIVDSSGAETFLETFVEMANSMDEKCLFNSVYMSEQSYKDKINILSTTLFFPRCRIGKFTSSVYNPMRRFCNHITIFGRNEKQGIISKLLESEPSVGSTIGGLSIDSSEGLQEGEAFMHQTELEAYPTLGIVQMQRITHLDEITASENVVNNSKIWLDVDCINVPWAPNFWKNIHRCSWSLSREIAADLRELLVYRKRAKDRVSRLDRTKGNIWTYRNAGL